MDTFATGSLGQCVVPGQMIIEMQPRNGIGKIYVELGREGFRPVEGGDVNMHLARMVVGFVCQGGAAIAAKTAPHAGRGVEDTGRAGGIVELFPGQADEGGDGGAGVAAATVAMTMGDPKRRAGRLEPDGPA